MSRDDYVTIAGVDIGMESNSGKAVSVKINDEWHWIPLSQVRAMHKNSRVHDEDSIEVSRWFADKEGLM